MKRSTKLTLIGSAFACGAVLPPSAQAGGIQLYDSWFSFFALNLNYRF